MNIRCSLSTHNLGDEYSEVETREECGNKITVEKTKRDCERCDHTEIVSETKEVVGVQQRETVATTDGGMDLSSVEEAELDGKDDALILDDEQEPSSTNEENLKNQEDDNDEHNIGRPDELVAESDKNNVEILSDDTGLTSVDENEPSIDNEEIVTDENSSIMNPDNNNQEIEEGDIYCPSCNIVKESDSPVFVGDACPDCTSAFLQRYSSEDD